MCKTKCKYIYIYFSKKMLKERKKTKCCSAGLRPFEACRHKYGGGGGLHTFENWKLDGPAAHAESKRHSSLLQCTADRRELRTPPIMHITCLLFLIDNLPLKWGHCQVCDPADPDPPLSSQPIEVYCSCSNNNFRAWQRRKYTGSSRGLSCIPPI